MPTYDYTCTACKKTLEIFHSMKEPAKKVCPACGKKALERQLGTGGAIIFKGSGFYQTDYRSEGYKKSAEAEKPASKDAKPAAREGTAKSTDTSKPDVKATTASTQPKKTTTAKAKRTPDADK